MVERRKQIIDRAAAVVYRQGVGATTIVDILAAANIGRGNFYHYFEGKEDFILAIIDALNREVGGVDLDEVFSPMKPPLRRLTDYLEIVCSSRRLDNCGDSLCTLASEIGATPPYAQRLKAALAGVIERFENLVSEFALETRTSVDARRVARSIVAQIHGLCIQYKVDGDVEALEAGIAAVPALLAGTVGARAVEIATPPASPTTGRAQAIGR